MPTNEIYDRCLANVNPAIKEEVRENMERLLAEQKAIDIDKAMEWAEQQNFSLSVQLDLRRFLEE